MTQSLVHDQPARAAALPPPPPPSHEQRVRAAFDEHFDCVWRYLRRIGLSEADADDGTQQAFMVLARKIERVEPGKERAYLCRTAHRIAADMRKQAHRRREVADDETDGEARDSLSPELLTTQKAARALLDHVLEQMPMELRTVFVLFEIEELTTQQIAETLDLASGTVASRLRRAREKFRGIVAKIKREDDRGGS